MIKKLLILLINTKMSEINNRNGYSDIYKCGMIASLTELIEDIKINL